jgi:hypothetical protein
VLSNFQSEQQALSGARIFRHGSLGNTQRRFHATRIECGLGVTTDQPCSSSSCAVCGILQRGFDISKAADGRFGRAIYSTSRSSKVRRRVNGIVRDWHLLSPDQWRRQCGNHDFAVLQAESNASSAGAAPHCAMFVVLVACVMKKMMIMMMMIIIRMVVLQAESYASCAGAAPHCAMFVVLVACGRAYPAKQDMWGGQTAAPSGYDSVLGDPSVSDQLLVMMLRYAVMLHMMLCYGAWYGRVYVMLGGVVLPRGVMRGFCKRHQVTWCASFAGIDVPWPSLTAAFCLQDSQT